MTQFLSITIPTMSYEQLFVRLSSLFPIWSVILFICWRQFCVWVEEWTFVCYLCCIILWYLVLSHIRLPWRSFVSGKYPLQSGATCLMEGKYCPLHKLASHLFLFLLGAGEVKVDCIFHATLTLTIFGDTLQLWRLGSWWTDCGRLLEEASGCVIDGWTYRWGQKSQAPRFVSPHNFHLWFVWGWCWSMIPPQTWLIAMINCLRFMSTILSQLFDVDT